MSFFPARLTAPGFTGKNVLDTLPQLEPTLPCPHPSVIERAEIRARRYGGESLAVVTGCWWEKGTRQVDLEVVYIKRARDGEDGEKEMFTQRVEMGRNSA